MEGHIFSALLSRKNEISNSPNYLISNKNPKSEIQISNGEAISYQLSAISYPSLSLLISGGHTELVLIKSEGEYEIVGQTRDDAVGEAFDKVARLLGLPYPGGPPLSALAERARTNADSTQTDAEKIRLPRPMIHSNDFDFSFSGIKTSVLYLTKKLPALTDNIKREISLEFENAVTEVLLAKTKAAAERYGARTLILGGGVVANAHIRREFEKMAVELNVPLHIPEKTLTTDNAPMIAAAGIARAGKAGSFETESLRAKGNLRLGAKLTNTLL